MQKALALVILFGAALGFALPSGKPAQPARAARIASGEARETLIKRSPMGHFYVDAEVNGALVHFVVDTGATMVALTVDDARRIGIPFSEDEFVTVGSGASGPVRGKEVMLDLISVDGKEVRHVPGAILEGSDISLLGQAYLTRLGSVEMSGDYMRLQ